MIEISGFYNLDFCVTFHNPQTDKCNTGIQPLNIPLYAHKIDGVLIAGVVVALSGVGPRAMVGWTG